jgi:hypothetical protein
MPIVIEEMTGEIVPSPRPEDEPRDSRPGPDAEVELRRRIREVLARQSRHAERLCDR